MLKQTNIPAQSFYNVKSSTTQVLQRRTTTEGGRQNNNKMIDRIQKLTKSTYFTSHCVTRQQWFYSTWYWRWSKMSDRHHIEELWDRIHCKIVVTHIRTLVSEYKFLHQMISTLWSNKHKFCFSFPLLSYCRETVKLHASPLLVVWHSFYGP